MKKYYYILTLGLLAGLASCTNDELPNAEVSDGVKTFDTFYATVADDIADTRSLLVNDTKFFFETGDKITVAAKSNLLSATIYAYNSGTGVFTGVPVSGESFIAMYPNYVGTVSLTGKITGGLRVDLAKDVVHQPDTPSQPMPLLAVSNDGSNNLQFYHTAGLIRFSLSGSYTVTKLTLKGNDGEQIAGTGFLDLTKDKPALTMYDDAPVGIYYGEQVMTFSGGSLALTPTPTYVYFVVPKTDFKHGLSLEIQTSDFATPLVKSTTSEVDLDRKQMITFASVDTDATLVAEASADLTTMNAIFAAFGNNPSLTGWGSANIADWVGVTTDHGMVTGIDISGKGISGTISDAIGNLKNLKTLNLSNNNLTGNVPATLINLKNLTSFDVSGNQMDGFVYDEVCFTDWWTTLSPTINPQQAGNSLKLGYISSDFSKDNEVKVLQTHSVGAGIPIVITCDAFSDRKYADFNTLAEQAKNYFFSIEPYKTYQNLFDVYSLFVVSNNERVGASIAFDTAKDGGSYSFNDTKITTRLEGMTEIGKSSWNVLTIVLLNIQGDTNRAICHMNYHSINGYFSAALIPVNEDMERVIHHEAGGHGFAFLADEYDSDDPGTTTFPSSQYADLDNKHALTPFGWYLNVDYHNNISTVAWKGFLSLPAYTGTEGVGIYEGGYSAYKLGVYRSTANSVMRDHTASDLFNAQSRWLIYKRMMKMAYGSDPAFSDFQTYDAPHITPLPPVAVTRNYVEKKHLLGAPPVAKIIK